MRYLDNICKKLNHLSREAPNSSFAFNRARQSCISHWDSNRLDIVLQGEDSITKPERWTGQQLEFK